MDEDRLQELVADLRARVERLESRAPVSPDRELVERLLSASGEARDEDDAGGTVVYAGLGPWGDGTVAWRTARGWSDVLGADPDALAAVFSALASPLRVQIVTVLADGALTTHELTQRLAQPTAGQLFHHIKELLACGVIHQPERGTYAIRHQHVVPLLAALSSALDLRRDVAVETAP
jgi:DNA-binding transcriptional ArsR family regulator